MTDIQPQPEPLKIEVKIPELSNVTSPQVIYILQCIKYMQQRMQEPEVKAMNFAHAYDNLCKDKNLIHFFERYSGIFIKVLENKQKDMFVLAGNLYFRDLHYRGEISETELADMLATEFMDESQKKESDKSLEKMKQEKS